MMTNGNNDTNAADDDVKNKSGLVFQCFSGADFFFLRLPSHFQNKF